MINKKIKENEISKKMNYRLQNYSRKLWILLAITVVLVLNTAARAQQTFDFNATRNPQFLVWDPGITAVGWYITPNISLNLGRIETNFNPVIQPGSQDRNVTLEILTDRRAVGGTLLRSVVFNSVVARGQLGGGNFAPVMLTAGTTYFIGFRNIAGIGINTTSDAGVLRFAADLVHWSTRLFDPASASPPPLQERPRPQGPFATQSEPPPGHPPFDSTKDGAHCTGPRAEDAPSSLTPRPSGRRLPLFKRGN